jgi:hypothetical protein
MDEPGVPEEQTGDGTPTFGEQLATDTQTAPSQQRTTAASVQQASAGNLLPDVDVVSATEGAFGFGADVIEGAQDSPVGEGLGAVADASSDLAKATSENVVQPGAELAGDTADVFRAIDQNAGPALFTDIRDLTRGEGQEQAPPSQIEQTTQAAATGFGESANYATVGAPSEAIRVGDTLFEGLEYTGEAVEEQGLEPGLEESYEAAAAVERDVIEQTAEQAQKNPARFSGAIAGGAVASVGTGVLGGRALGRAGRAARDRVRTAGGTKIPLEDLTTEDVDRFYRTGGESGERFPGAENPELYKTDPAEAVRRQAEQPDIVKERFGATDGEPILTKTLGVEPEGPGRGRAGQGFQSAPGESLEEFDYETPGSFAGPDVSPNFLGVKGRDPSFSLRPGLPDLGGQPTGVFIRTDVENPRASNLNEFNQEMIERSGETSAVTKPAGEVNPGEVEAVIPPGTEFADAGGPPIRNTLRRLGVGSDFYTEVQGRRVPLRPVVPDESSTVPSTPTSTELSTRGSQVDTGTGGLPDAPTVTPDGRPDFLLPGMPNVNDRLSKIRDDIADARAGASTETEVDVAGQTDILSEEEVREAIGTQDFEPDSNTVDFDPLAQESNDGPNIGMDDRGQADFSSRQRAEIPNRPAYTGRRLDDIARTGTRGTDRLLPIAGGDLLDSGTTIGDSSPRRSVDSFDTFGVGSSPFRDSSGDPTPTPISPDDGALGPERRSGGGDTTDRSGPTQPTDPTRPTEPTLPGDGGGGGGGGDRGEGPSGPFTPDDDPTEPTEPFEPTRPTDPTRTPDRTGPPTTPDGPPTEPTPDGPPELPPRIPDDTSQPPGGPPRTPPSTPPSSPPSSPPRSPPGGPPTSPPRIPTIEPPDVPPTRRLPELGDDDNEEKRKDKADRAFLADLFENVVITPEQATEFDVPALDDIDTDSFEEGM